MSDKIIWCKLCEDWIPEFEMITHRLDDDITIEKDCPGCGSTLIRTSIEEE